MQYIIILFFLILNNFFGFFKVDNAILLCLLIPFLFKGFRKYSIYKNYFILLFIGIILNFTSCFYFRGQNFFESFKAMPIFLYVLFYYVLKVLKPSLFTTEKVLLFLIISFDIIYILQFILIQKNINIFHIEEWSIGEDSNSTRLRMMSQGLFSLGIFFGINKFSFTRKPIYLLCIFLGVVITFLAAFRTFIVAVSFFIIFMLFKLKGGGKKIFLTLILGSIGMFGLIQIPMVSDKMDYVFSRFQSKDETLSNKDYIRLAQFRYFTKERPKNTFEYILGSGMPYGDSKYSKNFEANRLNGMQYVDWGLLGLSWMLGILPVLAMILYSLKVIRLKVDKRYIYIGVWYLYLLSTSLFEIEFYRYGNFLVQAIALYLVELAFLKREKRSTNNYKTITKL